MRPLARPKSIETAAVKRATQLAKGSVCGDSAIQGEYVGRVAAKTNGCGLSDAVKLSSVSGVKLSQKAVMDCTTAKALKKWIETGAKPVIGNQGGGLASLQIMGHYSCRPRNNQRGAKISEHGRGRAIDIGAFTLKNGVSFSVLRDWNRMSCQKCIVRHAVRSALFWGHGQINITKTIFILTQHAIVQEVIANNKKETRCDA